MRNFVGKFFLVIKQLLTKIVFILCLMFNPTGYAVRLLSSEPVKNTWRRYHRYLLTRNDLALNGGKNLYFSARVQSPRCCERPNRLLAIIVECSYSSGEHSFFSCQPKGIYEPFSWLFCERITVKVHNYWLVVNNIINNATPAFLDHNGFKNFKKMHLVFQEIFSYSSI